MDDAPQLIGVEFRMKDFGRVHPQAGYIGDATDAPSEENGDVEYLRADLVRAEIDRLQRLLSVALVVCEECAEPAHDLGSDGNALCEAHFREPRR